MHYVFVATFKNDSGDVSNEVEKNYMTLTLKQAGLLAINTFTKLTELCYRANGTLLLTPLSGACFSREDIPRIAADLAIGVDAVLILVNASSQGGGQYLPQSDASFALVGALSATRNLKDANLRKNIVTKVIRQYITQGKKPKRELVFALSKYATGGVPTEFSFEEMLNLFDSAQKPINAIQTQRVVSASVMPSTVIVPQ